MRSRSLYSPATLRSPGKSRSEAAATETAMVYLPPGVSASDARQALEILVVEGDQSHAVRRGLVGPFAPGGSVMRSMMRNGKVAVAAGGVVTTSIIAPDMPVIWLPVPITNWQLR